MRQIGRRNRGTWSERKCIKAGDAESLESGACVVASLSHVTAKAGSGNCGRAIGNAATTSSIPVRYSLMASSVIIGIRFLHLCLCRCARSKTLFLYVRRCERRIKDLD